MMHGGHCWRREGNNLPAEPLRGQPPWEREGERGRERREREREALELYTPYNSISSLPLSLTAASGDGISIHFPNQMGREGEEREERERKRERRERKRERERGLLLRPRLHYRSNELNDAAAGRRRWSGLIPGSGGNFENCL